MATNNFSKQEIVAFDQLLEGFQDALVLSKAVNIYGTNGTLMERSNDTIWRPVPYIGAVQTRTVGSNVTPKNKLQMSVPATLGYSPNDTWEMDALQMRDALQEGRLTDAAKQKMASYINTTVASVVSTQGSLVVAKSTSACSYDDVALCEAVMNEQGVDLGERYIAFNTRDYNGIAGNLVGSARSFGNNKSDDAFEKSVIGRDVAGFTAMKMDSGLRIAAKAGSGITMDTRASASNYYTPVAVRVSSTGEKGNVDNRYQTITVSSTTNVAAGDCFTVANINSVHHINKQNTGQSKTYPVISGPSSTTLVISPPMVSNQGGSDVEEAYQNCVVTSTSATAALTFLNTQAAGYNYFWRKPAIELLPGRYAVPTDQGVAVIKGSTDQGIELVMTKRFDPLTFKTTYTVDGLFGVVMTDPEQCGV